MAFSSAIGTTGESQSSSGAIAFIEQHWYAAYTCANHEKRVARELRAREVEHFLPLYGSMRRWKDRRKSLDLPLFPGYVFVKLALRDRMRVVQISSVVRLVGFNGLPAAILDEEMEILRSGLCPSLHPEPHPFLRIGRRVRVMSGPLEGMEGIIGRRKNACRLVIKLNLIQRVMSVEISEADVEAVDAKQARKSGRAVRYELVSAHD